MNGREHIQAGAAFLRERLSGFAPEMVLILGSGLGFVGDLVQNPLSFSYREIPGFFPATAPGHAGKLILGNLRGRRVAVLQGRLHPYEGHSMEEAVRPLRTLALLGAKTLIVTNAAGAVEPSFAPGDIMLIDDHIKLSFDSPLRGPNWDELGTRFPDMTFAYSPALKETALRAAAALGLPLRRGVYMYFPGPQYETPAEIRAARALGAQAVGMSTVPEVIAARHAGMETLGFSLLCNMAAGILPQALSEQEVLDAAAAAREPFSRLVLRCVEEV